MPEIPHKPYYKPSEVCSLTDTQPYVLRFWESEFPQLAPKKGVYRREDIDLVLRIKEMLNDQDRSIAEVRSALEKGESGNSASRAGRAAKKAPASAKASGVEAAPADPVPSVVPVEKKRAPRATEAKGVLPFSDKPAIASATDGVPRRRYEDALDEVAHLRLELQESESRRRKAENAAKQLDEEIQRIRGKSDGAIAQIEQLIGRLS